jgi:hypothetical protein
MMAAKESKEEEAAQAEETPTVVEEAQQAAAEREDEIAARPKTQEYIVLVQIGGSGDQEVWRPGSVIALNDERASLHLAAGNIQPLEHTELPLSPVTVQVIHDAPAAPATRKKGKH